MSATLAAGGLGRRGRLRRGDGRRAPRRGRVADWSALASPPHVVHRGRGSVCPADVDHAVPPGHVGVAPARSPARAGEPEEADFGIGLGRIADAGDILGVHPVLGVVGLLRHHQTAESAPDVGQVPPGHGRIDLGRAPGGRGASQPGPAWAAARAC